MITLLATITMNTFDFPIPQKPEFKIGKQRFRSVWLIPTITKKELANHFGFPDTRKLKRKMIQDGIYQSLKLSEMEYRKITEFTPKQTALIFKGFGLQYVRVY